MSKTASVGSSGISAATLTSQTSHGYKSVGTRDDLVRRALALIPMLRARAAEADALRRLPAETVRDLDIVDAPVGQRPASRMSWDVTVTDG